MKKEFVRRKSYPVVDRSYQYRILAMILIYGMIITLFLAVTLFIPEILRMQDESLGLEVRNVAANNILVLHARVWPAIISLICLCGLHSLRLSHRFFGPLYRFRLTFQHIRNGDLRLNVRLRRKDFLQKEAADINAMVDQLSIKIGGIEQAGQESLNSLADLKEMVEKLKGWESEDKKPLENLRLGLEKLMNTVSYFQLSGVQNELGSAQGAQGTSFSGKGR
jgi:hypothetical protein